jgi:pilus assembly protein CpaE
VNLRIFDAAQAIHVVLTADLASLKNVRIVLETLANLAYERSRIKLVLNRSTAFTGINVKNAEGALRHRIDTQIVNDYRGAISGLNSGQPILESRPDSVLGRTIVEMARAIDAERAREIAG